MVAPRSELEIVPVTFAEMCAFVQLHHRHHAPPQGWKFGCGVMRAGVLVGVGSAARPVAREIQTREPRTLEVRRTCTDGTRNANSMLYGALWRAARALGWTRCITYTQAGEDGASLRAAGWVRVREVPARGDWLASTVAYRHLHDPAQQTFWDDPRRRTGGVARVLWEKR